MKDIAKDTFLARVHPTLRWLFFLPAAILAAIILPVIVRLGWELTTGYDSGFMILVVQDLWTGGAFVFAGAGVAPKHQFIVSIVLLVIMSMFGLFSYLANFVTLTTTPLLMFVHGALTIGAGIYVVYIFHKHDKESGINDIS